MVCFEYLIIVSRMSVKELKPLELQSTDQHQERKDPFTRIRDVCIGMHGAGIPEPGPIFPIQAAVVPIAE